MAKTKPIRTIIGHYGDACLLGVEDMKNICITVFIAFIWILFKVRKQYFNL